MFTALAFTAPSLSSPWWWVGFVVFMLVAMVIDLGITGHRTKAMTTRTALAWCAVWISTAIAFGLMLWKLYGLDLAEQFFTGYLIEYSLSVDNLFVFVLVFAYFKTPAHLQHRALVWGIIGAMVMRATMIIAGVSLIERFEWMMAVFGAFLLYTGIKMLFHDDDADPSKSRLVRFLQARLPLSEEYHGEKFMVWESPKPTLIDVGPDAAPAESTGPQRRVFTRLFLVLLVIEFSDVIFAVDSIPAIFGVVAPGEGRAFIVFASNMFAILGLRSLYFAIQGAMQRLQYLNYGLSIVLSFIGVKMLLPFLPWTKDFHMKSWHSLLVVGSILFVTIAFSLWRSAGEGSGESGATERPSSIGLTSDSADDLPAIGEDEDEDEAKAADKTDEEGTP